MGRSTQVALLKEWLEDRGYAVLDTGLVRSELAGPGIKRAKQGHTLDPITLNLFYAVGGTVTAVFTGRKIGLRAEHNLIHRCT